MRGSLRVPLIIVSTIYIYIYIYIYILLTKTTAAQNEDALSYHTVRGLHYLAVIFVPTNVIVSHEREAVNLTNMLLLKRAT